MATMHRDRELDEQLEASRRGDRRKMTLLLALIALVALSTIANDFGDALGGLISAKGRVAVGVLGVTAAVLASHKPGLGWRLARIWAIAQIPVFAWSPDGRSVLALSAYQSQKRQIWQFPVNGGAPFAAGPIDISRGNELSLARRKGTLAWVRDMSAKLDFPCAVSLDGSAEDFLHNLRRLAVEPSTRSA